MDFAKNPFPKSNSANLASPIEVSLLHNSRSSYNTRNNTTTCRYNATNSSHIPSKVLREQSPPSPFKTRLLSISLDEGNPQAPQFLPDVSKLNDDDDYFLVADEGAPLVMPSAKTTTRTFTSIKTPRAHTGFQFFTPEKFYTRSRFHSNAGVRLRPKSHRGSHVREPKTRSDNLVFTPQRVKPEKLSIFSGTTDMNKEQIKNKESFISVSSQDSSKHAHSRDIQATPNLLISFIRGESMENSVDDISEQYQESKLNDLSMESSQLTGTVKGTKFKPQNIVQCYSFSTKAGTTFDRQKKDNQDAFIIAPKLLGYRYMHYFGVCDGHGPNGHFVSKFVKQKLLSSFSQEIKEMRGSLKRHRFEHQDIVESLRKSHISTNYDVCSEDSIDTRFSGSTSCSVLLIGSTLYCCNVGDSRVIIGQFRNGKWVGQAVSRDHKPDQPLEKSRIEKSGGVVKQFYESATKQYLGPMRVYSKKGEWPGLAMSRSIGDEVAKKLGVSSEPEISQVKLSSKDKFVLIASDGVWEFLSDNEVAEVVGPFYFKGDAEGGVRCIMRAALNAWKKRQSMIDDITCVLLNLNVPSNQTGSVAS